MTEKRQFSTFYVDGDFFGVEVEKVQEVIRYLEMTRIPLASQMVSGLMNLRGQIVTAIDLRKRLERGNRPEGTLPMSVIVRTGDGIVSLLVDEIGDVLEVDEECFEPPPETVRGVARELIRGAYKMDGALLLALDVEETVQIADRTVSVAA